MSFPSSSLPAPWSLASPGPFPSFSLSFRPSFMSFPFPLCHSHESGKPVFLYTKGSFFFVLSECKQQKPPNSNSRKRSCQVWRLLYLILFFWYSIVRRTVPLTIQEKVFLNIISNCGNIYACMFNAILQSNK